MFKAGFSGHNQYAPVYEGLDVFSHAYTSLHARRYHVYARKISLWSTLRPDHASNASYYEENMLKVVNIENFISFANWIQRILHGGAPILNNPNWVCSFSIGESRIILSRMGR